MTTWSYTLLMTTGSVLVVVGTAVLGAAWHHRRER